MIEASTGWVLLQTLGLVAGLLTLVWTISLKLRDVSIVDIVWGPGFAVAAWSYAWHAGLGSDPLRTIVVPTLVTLWGLRLGVHIFLRSRGHGEDYRYAEMRESWGSKFPWVSLFTVFWLQALLLWFISFPLHAAISSNRAEGWVWLDSLGLAVFSVGFLFEAVGDHQLTRFKADSSNKGQVLDTGLWRFTRHPNYFGDFLLWWGLFCFALATPGGWKWVLSPLIMSGLLMKVSGVALLEKKLEKSKPKYKDYIERTNAFFPWFPKS